MIGSLGGILLGAGAARADGHGEDRKPADAHGARRPTDPFHLHLCAFHVAKKNPSFAVEAHHYCSPVGRDLHQCVIYDSDAPGARILGIEYIVGDAIYRALPDEEKKFWHPHTYEILAGQLTVLGLEPDKETELMGVLLTTWGKTWHTWPDPATELPTGEALLMWSTSKDGQLDARRLAERDRRIKVDTDELRRRRTKLGRVPQIDPPNSVDALGRQWTNSGPDVPPAASK